MRWMQTIANSAREFWRVFQGGYTLKETAFFLFSAGKVDRL